MNYQVKIKSSEKKKHTKKKVPPWTKEQQTLYLRFIVENRAIFEQKKIDKCVFQTMAKFIGSESKGSKECHNYHIRMKYNYRTLENIIKKLQEEYGMTQEECKAEEQNMRKVKVTASENFQKQIRSWMSTLRKPEQPGQEFLSETKVIKIQLNLKFSL